MPQVDLETLVSVCGGGDPKIACETLAGDENEPPEKIILLQEEKDTPPDFPPESFWLSKDAELDWFDRNAFLERKESTKGNNQSTTANLNPNSNSSSQRFAITFKSKASIIGLPKNQKSCFADAKLRRNLRPVNIKLFPQRSRPVDKSTAVTVSEPSSPKVSCMGRVRSKRDRSRRIKIRQPELRRETGDGELRCEPEPAKTEPEIRRKAGLWKSLRTVFRTGRRQKSRETSLVSPSRKSVTPLNPPLDSPSRKARDSFSNARDSCSSEPVCEAPGLGGMNRFASGRRSSSWSVDEMLNFDVIKSQPWDQSAV